MIEHLRFEVVQSIVVLCEECQSSDTGEEKRDAAVCISQNLQQGIANGWHHISPWKCIGQRFSLGYAAFTRWRNHQRNVLMKSVKIIFRLYSFPWRACWHWQGLSALFLPGHTVTVILSPLVRCIAAAVRSGQWKEPVATAAKGTDRPVVRLQTPTQREDVTQRSYKLSVTPGHQSGKAVVGPGPSRQFSPPPCR